MPRITPYLALTGLFFGCAFLQPSVQAAPVSATSARNLSGSVSKSRQSFRSLGINGPVTRVRAIPPLQATSGTAVRTSQSVRVAAASQALVFKFDSGFTNAQITALRKVLSAYSVMVTVFGEPAAEQSGKTITVRSDGPGAAYQPLLKPNATDGGTIYFRYATGDSEQVNRFAFTRLVLLAFQGPNNFSYDYAKGNYVEPWQYGFADAAALLVTYYATAAADKPNFDPSQLTAYVLPVYDYFNHPELGNAYIYSRTDTDLVISDFRAAMAQAAWLKVAVENPRFFALFNAAYYAQVPARTAVNTNQLRSIAASIAPKVEGLSFADWIRRQYVLDTTVTTGQKLYTAILPIPIINSSDLRSGFRGFAQAFTTDSNGDEKPSTGYGSVNAFDEKGTNINTASSELKASNLLDFTTNKGNFPGQASFGAGFSSLGSPNRARITLKLRYQNAETTGLFPYLGGGAPTDITYYGVTSLGDSGTLAITPKSGTAESVTVARGAWTGTKKYVSGPQVVTTLRLGDKSFVRNSAWLVAGDDALGQGFILDGTPTSSSFTLKIAEGASKLRMVSLPFYPLESDEATILGVTSSQLQLARYRPNLAPGTLTNGTLSFGITGDRHELYPNISAPMAPGRGYWLGVDGASQRAIKGTEPPRTTPYEAPILGGWNQIGVPFNRAFKVDALKVRYGGFAAVSYATALTNGWVRPGIWKWLPRGGYSRVDDGSTSATLQPFEGYYVFASPARGVSLVFDSAASSEPAAITTGWTAALSAATSTSRDASNRFGVSSLTAAAKPPAAAQVVTLRFVTSGAADSDASGAGAASGWADSFLPAIEREGKWSFVVDGVKKSERVTLSWGDLKRVPSDLKVTLEDTKAGSQLRLTSGGSYKFTAEGVQRSFTLRATRAVQAIISVDAVPTTSVNIGISLNVASKGRLEIRNAASDTIAILKAGDFAAKKEKFVWNGLQTNGKNAPAGRYTVIWTPEDKNDKQASYGFSRK